MATPPARFSQLRWLQTVTCIAAIIGSLLLIAYGVVQASAADRASGIWMIALGGMGVFLAIVVMTLTPLILKMEATQFRVYGELRDLNEAITRHGATLSSIAENTRISDAARALAHRSEELDALRTAIREDIRAERWESALYLVDEIERRFGFKEEAEQLREEVDDARRAAIERKLQEAIAMVESHFASYEWDRAQKEIDRLRHALPDHPRVLGLQERMKVLKDEHKQQLRVAWDDAVRRSDTDHAIDILKELDQYLTPAEAQELQDSARDVFKEKLLRLGVQFRFAVTEKRWQDALNIGLELIREFPNARMANEVRDVLDTLRERARIAAEQQERPAAPLESRVPSGMRE